MDDKDTGLIHLGYREYDPAVGRFITPDPLGFAGGDVDVYGYCLDDPINFHDRTGLAGKSEESNEKSIKNTKLAGAENAEHPSDNVKNRKTKYAGADRNEELSRYDKKAGADNSSPAPSKNKSDGANLDAEKEKTKNDSILKFGDYVIPEKREIFKEMASSAHETGSSTVRKGFTSFGPASLFLYPVGASIGALDSLVRGPVQKAIIKKIEKSRSNSINIKKPNTHMEVRFFA